MKLFLADGRLGNQIFQYAFLKTIQQGSEKIIVTGFEELKEVFDITDIWNLNKKNKLIKYFLFKICSKVFMFLSNKKLISSVEVDMEKVLNIYERELTTYKYTKGSCSWFTFIKPGFFQSEFFFNRDVIKNLVFRQVYLKKAEEILDRIPKISHIVFIHIRRGDYKDYMVYGKQCLLPLSYYHERIKWFLGEKQNSYFIFLCDEPDFIEKEFQYLANKIISYNNHYGVDLAIMSLCESAVLSPSSFGWWGSYLMNNRDTIFAPKCWLGFSSGIEYNKSSTPSYAQQILISE